MFLNSNKDLNFLSMLESPKSMCQSIMMKSSINCGMRSTKNLLGQSLYHKEGIDPRINELEKLRMMKAESMKIFSDKKRARAENIEFMNYICDSSLDSSQEELN